MVKETALLSAVSIAIGLKVPSKRLEIYYKSYSFLLIVALAALNGWSLKSKLERFKLNLTLILDALTTIVAVSAIAVSVVLGTLRGDGDLRRKIDAKFERSMGLTDEYNRKQKKFLYGQIFFNACLMVAYYFTVSIDVGLYGWDVYKYYVAMFFDHYVIAIATMCVHTFVCFLGYDFRLFNERLAKIYDDFLLGKDFDGGKTKRLRIMLKLHDMLCDLIDDVNKAFGLRVLLLLLYTSLSILQSFELVLNHWQENFNQNLPFLLHFFLSFILLVICVMVVSSCESTTFHANAASPTSYKLLLQHEPPPDGFDSPSQENIFRQNLLMLARQVEQRSPYFTAAGFFPIGYTSLYGMIATVFAYVVIVIQLSELEM